MLQRFLSQQEVQVSKNVMYHLGQHYRVCVAQHGHLGSGEAENFVAVLPVTNGYLSILSLVPNLDNFWY